MTSDEPPPSNDGCRRRGVVLKSTTCFALIVDLLYSRSTSRDSCIQMLCTLPPPSMRRSTRPAHSNPQAIHNRRRFELRSILRPTAVAPPSLLPTCTHTRARVPSPRRQNSKSPGRLACLTLINRAPVLTIVPLHSFATFFASFVTDGPGHPMHHRK